VARVAGTTRGIEAFHELGANAPQQKVDRREILHLPLDDDGEARRHVSKQEHPIDVTGMVGDDNAVALRQFFESANFDRHAC